MRPRVFTPISRVENGDDGTAPRMPLHFKQPCPFKRRKRAISGIAADAQTAQDGGL
jgi:hypothetical protein